MEVEYETMPALSRYNVGHSGGHIGNHNGLPIGTVIFDLG